MKRVTLRIDTEGERRRREREVEVAERLEAVGADHVVPVLDIGRVDDVLLIVMPLAKRTFAAALRTGDLDDPGRTDAIRPVALGLQELAEASILHRDLKPANVLEFDGRWQLADFGIARDLLESTGIYTFLGAGTLPYMAPELWRGGRSTAKTDLYALGVTAYEVLVGNRPFSGRTEDDYRAQHLNDAPAAPKGLPDGMTRLVLRLFAKDPTARPQNARAVVEAIDAAERQLTPAQDALRSVALDAERRRGETEAARARLLAATNQWESDRSQAIEDLREIVLQAHELAKDVRETTSLQLMALPLGKLVEVVHESGNGEPLGILLVDAALRPPYGGLPNPQLAEVLALLVPDPDENARIPHGDLWNRFDRDVHRSFLPFAIANRTLGRHRCSRSALPQSQPGCSRVWPVPCLACGRTASRAGLLSERRGRRSGQRLERWRVRPDFLVRSDRLCYGFGERCDLPPPCGVGNESCPARCRRTSRL